MPLGEEIIKQSEIMDGDEYMHFTVKQSNVLRKDIDESYLPILRVMDKMISMQKFLSLPVW